MKILALDPAIELTGWALLEDDGSQDGRPLNFGLIRNTDSKDLGMRGISLAAEVRTLVQTAQPTVIVVELPAATGRAWGGYRNRSVLSAPVYGFAVGVVWMACQFASMGSDGLSVERMITVPADVWSVGLSKGDDEKTRRVRTACWLYKLPEGQLGPKTTAGNVADAILIARWCLLNQRQLTTQEGRR